MMGGDGQASGVNALDARHLFGLKAKRVESARILAPEHTAPDAHALVFMEKVSDTMELDTGHAKLFGKFASCILSKDGCASAVMDSSPVLVMMTLS
jgi:hypothetical protein